MVKPLVSFASEIGLHVRTHYTGTIVGTIVLRRQIIEIKRSNRSPKYLVTNLVTNLVITKLGAH